LFSEHSDRKDTVVTSPVKLAHVVLWTRQIPQMRDWYLKVLDARVVYQNPAAAFLTYDSEHHRVALAHPEAAAAMASELEVESDGLVGVGAKSESAGGKASSVELSGLPLHGLAHVAFTYATLDELLDNYTRLNNDGVAPTTTINHGTTTSMYYADPDSNQVELQVDNFATIEEGVAFMESESFARNPVGVPFEPEVWIKRRRAGEPAADLMRPAW
jgi:catechol-2,3-dioxygenase